MMPPLRSMSAIKPMKTERTHEENQERAYIAASRRSDRSLEARVESARRASEIHKRRTGRSLRVTEQDVLNEEMYEEEDDDLPMQYRRLTAHLQTSNMDFNRRLQSYLAQQVGIRNSFGHAMYGQLPNGPFMNPGMMQMPQQHTGYQTPAMQQQMFNQRSASYRQSPYPMPQNNMHQGMQHALQNRSASISTPQDLPWYQQQQLQPAQNRPETNVKHEERRASLPAQVQLPQTPQSQQAAQLSPAASRTGSSSNVTTPPYTKSEQSPRQISTSPQHTQHQQSPFNSAFNRQMDSGIGPLSMQLPMETQQLLARSPTTHDFSDQKSSMNGAQPQQPMYSYNPNGRPRQSPEGLKQTLTAPLVDASAGAFDTNPYLHQSPSATTIDSFNMPYQPSALGLDFDNNFDFMGMKGEPVHETSGQVTPIFDEALWSSFMDDQFVSPEQFAV